MAALKDLTDDQLREAGRAWCDQPRDARGFRPWPSAIDLRDALRARQSAAAGRAKPIAGCDDCDGLGWRTLLRIDHRTGKRLNADAPCDCPKGLRFSNPPPIPANYPGPHYAPPEPWRKVAEAWTAQGFEVQVTAREQTRFPLSLTNPEAWERAKEHNAKQPGGAPAFLRRAMQGAKDLPPADLGAQAPTPEPDPEAWRKQVPF